MDWGHSWSGRCTSWNLSWRRERFEWEKHLEAQLLSLIVFNGIGKDKIG